MKLLEKLFKQKVSDKSNSKRLAVVLSERALREGYNYRHLEDVLDAREYIFNERVQLKKVGKYD